MDAPRKPYSIFKEISDTQHNIHQFEYKIEVIERNLKMREMSTEERDKLEAELREIKMILKENEAAVKALQQENLKTPSLAILFFLLCFCVYCIYCLFTNPN